MGVAEACRLRWTSQKRGGEELPHVRGQGQWPRVPGCDGVRTAERSYPSPRSGAEAGRSYPTPPHLRLGAVARRSYPTPEARGGGREDQPHARGQGQWPGGPSPVAVQVQEGLREAIPF